MNSERSFSDTVLFSFSTHGGRGRGVSTVSAEVYTLHLFPTQQDPQELNGFVTTSLSLIPTLNLIYLDMIFLVNFNPSQFGGIHFNFI